MPFNSASQVVYFVFQTISKVFSSTATDDGSALLLTIPELYLMFKQYKIYQQETIIFEMLSKPVITIRNTIIVRL